MVDNQALRSMALGAMTVVAVSILTATTLLPALIAMLGDRVMPGGVVGQGLSASSSARSSAGRSARRPAREARRAAASGSGWTARVMARPWRAVIGVTAVLLFLAIPLLSLETGTEALGQFPKGSDVRVGNELASAAARRRHRPGADRRRLRRRAERADRAAVAGFVRELEATPGVASVAPPAFAGDSVLIQATPSAPQRVRRGLGAGRPPARQRRPGHRAEPASPPSTSAAKPPAATTSAPRSAARCGRSSSSSSRSASSS